MNKKYNIIKTNELVNYIGQEVELRGWIHASRSSGKICFLQFRDGTGGTQVVCAINDVEEDVFKNAKRIQNESCVIVKGIPKIDKRSPWGVELILKDITLFSESLDYPLGRKEHGSDFLLENRHLWLRSLKQSSIMRIRSSLSFACHKFFQENGFYLFNSPIFTPTACEGTTTLFEVNYFGLSAFLSQSGQLYSEAGIFALEKVYCFGPVFRAEKSKTRRHLTEFWCVEPEMAWYDAEDNMKLQEKFIKFIVDYVIKNNEKDLLNLERKPEDLDISNKSFEILLYDEAIKLLKNNEFNIKWGEDFGVEEEEFIAKQIDKPFFIYKYPVECRAFYIEPDPQRPEVALSSDCMLHDGFGEIITGGQRASSYDFLVAQMKKHNLNIEDFGWYLDLRKYGSVPHSGFGMGIERMTRWLCNIRHVRETIPFPRMLNRYRP